MAQQESGTLAAPSIDPSWRQVELLIKNSVCEQCGISFPPKRQGQRFCSNKCGDLARKVEIDRSNKLKEQIRLAEQRAMKEAGLVV